MPIIHIHKVTATIGKAIDYCKNDKIEREIVKDDIADTVNYARNDKTGEYVFKTQSSYINSRSNGYDFSSECKELLEKFPRKRKAREGENPALLFHIVQSFDGHIPTHLANQIGLEFAKETLGRYLVQVSTHTNTDNIHNHIVFCAVNMDGERYNDCDSSYAELRRVSDRISEKYGLNILEKTREYKPIHWTDKDGNRRSYEPTNRKNDMIEKKAKGELSRDDISSYRNFEQYRDFQIKNKSQKMLVVEDIEKYLPLAINYEHLLNLLRENLGYSIKDKKKNGEYLEHILFIHPMYSKGVRDSSLSENGYFKRENLEKIIEQNVKEQQMERTTNEISHGEIEQENYSDIPIITSYDYEKFDFSAIDESKRAWKKDDGTRVVLDRGEPEQTVIRSAKKIETESIYKFQSDGFERGQANYILRHANNNTKEMFNLNDEQLSYAQIRANAIQERLNCLRFIEENNLYNYNRINLVMESFWENYNSSFEKMNEIGERLEKLRFICNLPNLIENITKRIEVNSHNTEYIENELEHDKLLVEKYKSYLFEKGLDSDSEKMNKLKNDLANWESKYNELSNGLIEKKNKLVEYERSVEILKESAGGSRSEFVDMWKGYIELQSKEKEREKENEFVKRKHEKKQER